MPKIDNNVLKKVTSKLEIAEDGQLSMNDIVSLLLQSKEAPVNRAEFLKEAFAGKYDDDVINKAIETSPSQAGISTDDLRQIANEIILKSKENTKTSTAVKEAVAEDKNIDKVVGLVKSITESRNIKELLKTAQKILYLFGFPVIGLSESGMISSAKARLVMMMSLAVMFDVDNADKALKAIAGVINDLPENMFLMQNLSEEEIGKILMKWRKKFVAATAAMKAAESNPLLGVVAKNKSVDMAFEKNCAKLVDALSDTSLSNSEHIASEKETGFAQLIKAAAIKTEED